MGSEPLGFVACAEAGPLEGQVLLLIRSLRRWGGRFSQAPCYVFSPRPGHRISEHTIAELSRLGAEYIDAPLNPDHGEYPVDNKIFACSWAETHLDWDVIAFLDSDTVFVNPPQALSLEGAQVALRPVDLRGAGSEGPYDDRDAYWQRAYALCESPERRTVVTTVDGVKIREYWNAGLVAAKRSLGLFSLWQAMYRRLSDANLRPQRWPRQLDQIALAMATSRLASKHIVTLGPEYNYPLPRRPWLSSSLASLAWDQLVHLHYHRWFSTRSFLERLTPPLHPEDERFVWLQSHLPLEPVSDEVFDRHIDNKPG